ncbi:MAG TPA: PAS domain S-box protein [Gallionellaceae bacterium]|nr:PAS domain S-box protein [Gallionellaceae bacterium]
MSALDHDYSNLSDHTGNEPSLPHETLTIVFDDQGAILECSPNCRAIVGYTQDELLSTHIAKLVLHLATVPLFVHGEFNPQVSFLSHCGMPFRIKRRDGNTFDGIVSVVQLHHLSRPAVRMLVNPPANEHAPGPRAGR